MKSCHQPGAVSLIQLHSKIHDAGWQLLEPDAMVNRPALRIPGHRLIRMPLMATTTQRNTIPRITNDLPQFVLRCQRPKLAPQNGGIERVMSF
jgi:hypothetical protein